ncbi:AfsR/SARP family transcriptional regulator [Streptomyces africanus]|uniref:AfsR/SARP family transcriptional regulator n=1 Tax=Streptomyces africanus TaxID=231024 RepID=UPI000D1A8309|nr:BTAD domain-containing putative transcriptional regulator [Streptomyces africanus]
MDIKVLGALVVMEGAMPIAPAAAEPRQVLALLAVFAGRVVPSGLLVEDLWPDRPPHQAKAMLQSYVGELRERTATALRSRERRASERGRCERQAADILADLPGGYQLRGDGATSDAWEFERAAGAGYRALAAGDLLTGARRLREALGLWRGEPFADIAPGPHLAAQIDRLRQSRDRAFGRWVEAELRLGRYRELAADLPCVQVPGRVRDQLPAALERCTDQWEALAAYQRLTQPSSASRFVLTARAPGPGMRPLGRAVPDPRVRPAVVARYGTVGKSRSVALSRS